MLKLKKIKFLIENDDLLEKYNTIWDKVSTDIKKNLIASLSIINFFKNQNKISWQWTYRILWVIRHINDNLNCFLSSDQSDDSDEE